MKNTELFDILGNIDDKFYDEALGGDSERPVEILIKKPAFSIKNVLMPVAACLAVAAGIGVTAHFLNRTDFIDPNRTISDVVLENPNITSADLEQCRELVQKYLPSASSEEFDFEHNTKIIDIDFDGVDEVVMTPRTSMIVIFDKTPDGMVDTAQLIHGEGVYGAENIYKYDLNGEQYYYFPYYYSSLKGVIANAMIRIKFDEGEYSIDYPLAYGYYYGSDPKEWFFMADCTSTSEFTNDPISNISAEEFKSKWESHTELPKFDYYLSIDDEYPLLSEVEIPTIESAFMSADNMLHGATLDVRNLGEYKLCLFAKNVFRLADSDDPDYFYAGSLILSLVKDNTVVSSDGVSFYSTVHDGFANYYLDPQKLDSYLKLYKLQDCDVAVFGYVNSEKFGWESNFFGIKDGVVTKLFGQMGASGDEDYFGGGISYFANAPLDLTVDGNSLIDNKKAVKYEFNPDAFEGNPYEVPHFTKTEFIPGGDYPMYDGKAAPKATLCEKKLNLDNGTVKLLALDAKPVTKNGIEYVEFSELFLRADFGSDSGWVKRANVPGSLPVSKLDECLVPILFNAGKPDSKELIAVFWGTEKVSPAGEKYDNAVFHSSGNGEPFHMDKSQSGAIIPSGDPCELGAFTVSPEGCMISLDVGVQISFDFTNYTFKHIYPEQ